VARARRAKARFPRVLVALIVVVVALLVGGAVSVLLFWPGALAAVGSSPAPVQAATQSSVPATATAVPSVTPSRTAAPTSTATKASPIAISAMKACRERVQAADEVLEQARTGVLHWKAHVDAEREAAEGTISIAQRQRIFNETRQQGPGDQKRYAAALRAYDKVKDASCGKARGADAAVAATLARCQQRAKGQATVMRAAAAAMGDWKQHLADMQRSREVHVKDAQQVWIEAYKAAPPNINAFIKAGEEFKKAPKC
jgi:hypothetical protein